MKILIVGGGKLIYFLARTFVSKGYTVTIINRDREECSWLARQLKATVVYGDGSDPRILEEAGAAKADAVMTVTPNDQDNLVICQLANLRFHVPRILALVNDPDNEEVFRQLGIPSALSTTRVLSSLIEQQAGLEDIINLTPVAEGKVSLTEIVLKADAPVVKWTLQTIDLPKNSLVVCILRNGQPIIPRGTTRLAADDRLFVVTLPENHREMLKVLTGETI